MKVKSIVNKLDSQQVADNKTHIDARINYWLLHNMDVMKQMSIIEPVCWYEVDTPGIRNE